MAVSHVIERSRIREVRAPRAGKGEYVLYWMQSSVRSGGNMALAYAFGNARTRDLPVVTCFCIDPSYPEANLRHFTFLSEGILSAGAGLSRRKIPLVLRRGDPVKEIADLAKDAAFVVTDRGYLSYHKRCRETLAREIGCPFIEVEDNVIVPVERASQKEEWSAGTFRRKMERLIPDFLDMPGDAASAGKAPDVDGIPYQDVKTLIHSGIDSSVGPSPIFRGGEDEARRRLETFIGEKLSLYPSRRNDPSQDVLSHLSPYLHFGNISPVECASRVMETQKPGMDEFLDQLIVRRELAVNFVHYNPRYDSFQGLPAWARATLGDHARDLREYTYTARELEGAKTHDPYWNACQNELVITGKMHGYMRMYWAKKILEWTRSPEEAYSTALVLNNRYELDGRDPSSYAGVAWCFGKHDRPWPERPVLGKVRYMNAAGLERKFSIESYVQRVEALIEKYGIPGRY
ncbi:MAG: deoxyribodipyrimidine photo-lyase [Methanolinea sp.]|jgi:deoxyribodipyrimidine photo-lyase|nr:deoxyribodipyrimidine photo-lyase [Methanolinea sp.]